MADLLKEIMRTDAMLHGGEYDYAEDPWEVVLDGVEVVEDDAEEEGVKIPTPEEIEQFDVARAEVVENTSFEFDKYMDVILINETVDRTIKTQESPQRARAARNQDRPLNKIRFGGV